MNRSTRLLLLSFTFGLAACSGDPAEDAGNVAEAAENATAEAAENATAEAAEVAEGDPLTITVIGHDFSFDAPDTVPAGPTMVRLVNQGAEMHHVQIFRVDDGHTPAELGEALAGGQLPAWAVPVGGPSAAAPGQEIATEVDLAPGQYVLSCLIPSPDGTPHLAKGMVRALAVADNTAPPAAMATTMDVELRDYGFVFAGEVTAGTHTFRVFNTAAQPHEVLFVRLEEGRTAQEVIEWSHAPAGPPPGTPIGGVGVMATGLENRLALTFEPGRYALICFVPDATDGQPHYAHGMVQEFDVR